MFHPVTGRRYVLCLRDDAATYRDIRVLYLTLAADRPWLVVATPEVVSALLTVPRVVNDPRWVFVLWEPLPLPVPAKCDATITAVYSEAYGGSLLPTHRAHWARFKRWADQCDWVWCHTPKMQGWLHAEGFRTRLLPVCTHPCLGTPGPSAATRTSWAYWGSRVGLRETLVPAYASLLDGFVDFTGHYGSALHDVVDQCRGALYLPHSRVWSGSTWRMWQAVSTSTPLISKETDLWPAEPHTHYLVPPSQEPVEVVEWLRTLSWGRDLAPVAKKARADLAEYDPLHYLTAT